MWRGALAVIGLQPINQAQTLNEARRFNELPVEFASFCRHKPRACSLLIATPATRLTRKFIGSEGAF
jgi:hypothetical protein